jgi:hypothetical protein
MDQYDRSPQALVELAAIIASHGGTLLRSPGRVSTQTSQRYWVVSRSRLDRWARHFYRIEKRSRGDTLAPEWRSTSGLLAEVLASELVTRVWTALACRLVRVGGCPDAEAYARSILDAHLAARRRALRILVTCRGLPLMLAAQSNKLRRQAERWTDLLLAYLTPHCEVDEFSFEPGRVADFATSIRPDDDPVFPLLLEALRTSYRSGSELACPNPRLNQRIAESLLTCLGPDMLESTGRYRLLWQWRLLHITADTQRQIDHLLAETYSGM